MSPLAVRAHVDVSTVVRVRIVVIGREYNIARGASVNVKLLNLLEQLAYFTVIASGK